MSTTHYATGPYKIQWDEQVINLALSSTNQHKYRDYGFDASLCSSVYGGADTNQPKSLRALCLIRAYQA